MTVTSFAACSSPSWKVSVCRTFLVVEEDTPEASAAHSRTQSCPPSPSKPSQQVQAAPPAPRRTAPAPQPRPAVAQSSKRASWAARAVWAPEFYPTPVVAKPQDEWQQARSDWSTEAESTGDDSSESDTTRVLTLEHAVSSTKSSPSIFAQCDSSNSRKRASGPEVSGGRRVEGTSTMDMCRRQREEAQSTPEQQEEDGTADAEPTTMMIRNIPCRCSKSDVIGDIDSMGFAGLFDFFYLPQDRSCKTNLGYAFINFLTPEAAADFMATMRGHRFTCRTAAQASNSRKVCAISPAAIQGLENNQEHFRRTHVFKSVRGPSFFQGAVESIEGA